MTDLHARVREQRNPLERLIQSVPGFRGYSDRENRREADRALRQLGVSRLERLISEVQEVIKQTPLGEIGRYQDLIAAAERMTNELRHADQGYSGFFDELKWDGDDTLSALYVEDEAIVAMSEELAAQVETGEFDPGTIQRELQALRKTLADRRYRILELLEV